MAEKLNATLTELISELSGKESEPSDGKLINSRLRWAQRLIAKRHYSAVHAESVYEVYENGLLERLSVLGRPDLADMLAASLKKLDKRDYVTAQILLMLKQLSMNPETQVTKSKALEIGRDNGNNQEQLKRSLAIDEIMDGLADDFENWDTDWAFTEEANALYMEDEDTEESSSISTHSENLELLQNSENEEFRLFLSAVQRNGVTENLPVLSGGDVDVDLQQFCEQSYWNLKVVNDDRPIIISEATAVREVVLVLRGLPSVLIVETNNEFEYSVVDAYRVLHFSRPMLVSLLMTARDDVLSTSRIRTYLNFKKPSCLQVLDGAIETLILKPFYETLDIVENSILTNDTTKITTLSNLIRDVQSITKTWIPVLEIIEMLIGQYLEMESYDERHCFSVILQELHSAVKVSHLQSLAVLQNTNSTFHVTLQVFGWCMDYYCGVLIDSWIRSSDTVAYKPQFFVEQSSTYQESKNSYWASRYRINSSIVPPFLKPLVQPIYEAGLSLRFLDKIQENTLIEADGLSFKTVIGSPLNQADLWWLKLPLRLEKWVLISHQANARKLMNIVVYESGLVKSLKSYTQLYLMLDEIQPVMEYFLHKTFDRMDRARPNKIKLDKFLVQEEFEEAWSLIDKNSPLEKRPFILLQALSTEQIHGQEKDSANVSIPLDLELLGRLRLEVPSPWIVREVLGETTKVYQSLWTTLLLWSYAQHIVKHTHLVLLRNRSSQLNHQFELTHAVLVFINKLMEYFHISVLQRGYQKAKHLMHQNRDEPAVNDKDGAELLWSFQDLIDSQEEFIYSAGDLCFVTLENPFIVNVQTALIKILHFCVTKIPDLVYLHQTHRTGGREETDRHAASDDEMEVDSFYESIEYFVTSKVEPLQKALQLALANNSFMNIEEKEAVENLIQRLE